MYKPKLLKAVVKVFVVFWCHSHVLNLQPLTKKFVLESQTSLKES